MKIINWIKSHPKIVIFIVIGIAVIILSLIFHKVSMNIITWIVGFFAWITGKSKKNEELEITENNAAIKIKESRERQATIWERIKKRWDKIKEIKDTVNEVDDQPTDTKDLLNWIKEL